MAASALAKTKVFVGRIQTLTINDAEAAEKFARLGVKDGVIVANEEVKELRTELEDGTEIVDQFARKVTVELTLAELNDTDIDSINLGTDIIVTTASGGANETGQTFTIEDADSLHAQLDGLKTKIVVTKTLASTDAATLPYAVADVAA